MLEKILVPSDLSDASNSVMPHAVTLAQAFHSKLYLLHVMDPASLNKPECLLDFPKLSRLLTLDLGAPDLPPLRKSINIAKMYLYKKNRIAAILDAVREKKVDLVCLAANNDGINLAWWSVGTIVESLIARAPCHVLCIRGRPIKDKDWKRPRFQHVLLLTELGLAGAEPLLKVLPWVHKLNSMLHIFPLVTGRIKPLPANNPLPEAARLNPARTNVLLFADPAKRMKNLLSFVEKTPIDLIVMAPRTRAKFSNRLLNDILAKLLRVTDSPVLLLR
jgi:nucleotide-binding universal stress UspA family protein